MKLPFVSRARLDLALRNLERMRRIAHRYEQNGRDLAQMFADANARYDSLLEKYHALRVSGANAPKPEKVIPPVEQPPAEVMRAIRVISPRNDAAFYANWRLWEENKDVAKENPKVFADRIKRGRLQPEGQPIENGATA